MGHLENFFLFINVNPKYIMYNISQVILIDSNKTKNIISRLSINNLILRIHADHELYKNLAANSPPLKKLRTPYIIANNYFNKAIILTVLESTFYPEQLKNFRL